MKKVAIVLLLVAGMVAAWFVYKRRHQGSWVSQHYTKKDVLIPMRDGTKLYTIIYIPKDTKEKHPIIINRTPYSVLAYGENSIKSFTLWNNFYDCYFKENYIIVRQDVRGRFKSEGTFAHLRPHNTNKKDKEIDEASDTYDTIDCLVKNIANNNGNVGMFGISYPGFYTAMGALSKHPALKAISPQAPALDWFRGDDWHHNGAFMESHAFDYFRAFKPHEGFVYPAINEEARANNSFDFYLNAGTMAHLHSLMGDSITFWNEMYEHPNYDDYWDRHNAENYIKYFPDSLPCLVVGGFFDAENLYGTMTLFDSVEKYAPRNNSLVMGPWRHEGWSIDKGDRFGNITFGSNTSEYYQKNIELPFFNYYLKNKGSRSDIKKTNIFFTGSNEWKSFDAWPPKNKENQTMYLLTNGALGAAKDSGSNAGYIKYISDPAKPVPYVGIMDNESHVNYMIDDQRFAGYRPDVLVFKTDTLTSDITLAGPIVADLFTSISTTDADFVVKLIDVYPDNTPSNNNYPLAGYEMLVRGEVMRGKYRNSFSNPEPFVPNKVTEVKYTLPDVAHVFKKGHRIMVQVQSTWFPMIDRNPQQFVNIYTCTEKDFVTSEIKVHTSGTYPSSISLPVLK